MAGSVAAQERGLSVRVGVYNNFPQVFLDDDGTPHGIYVDLLSEIATLEGWTLHFVPGTFAEGLERVRSGNIDIMTSIAATPERDQVIDFSKETIVSVWAQLYVQPNFEPQNVFDMADRKVAVMRDGLLGIRFGQLCQDFEVPCVLVPVESYDHALQAVDDGVADAAVVNSLLGFSREDRYKARRSSIVFSPFRLQVALPEGQNAALGAAIDRHLADWRKDKNSFYYKTLDRWLGIRQEPTVLRPMWVWWLVGGISFALLLVFAWTRLLSRQVALRTAAYQESQARYQELVEHMTSGVVVYQAVDDGQDFVFKAVNRGAETIESVDRTSLIGKRLSETFPGVEAFGLLEILRRVWRSGEPAYMPATLYQDGEKQSWRENRLFKIPTGEVVALFDDVTRRVAAEAQLRRSHDELERRVRERTESLQASEERFRSLVENTHIVAWALDLQSSRFTYMSPHAEALFGYPLSEWCDMDFWASHIHPEDREQALNTCSVETAAGRNHTFEYRMIKADGQVIWLQDIVNVGKDPSGTATELNGFMVDITRRKEFEEKLASSNAELEKFAYVASHDLREPLRMVTSYCQLLSKQYQDKLDDTAKEYIAFAVDGATRMDRLIQDLLHYSRVNTQREAFRETPLGDLLNQALAYLRPRMESLEAKVIAGPLPTLAVDQNQMIRLFQNLIANALTYHRKDVPPKIIISALRHGDFWQFTIEDNGLGIETVHLERIFVIFQRLHTHDKYEGTGIGLAVCRKIVQLHGGKLWADSVPGEGSRFHFTLPVTSPSRVAEDGPPDGARP
ncbi:ATP-binding protein [Magnetospira thiophila]